MFLRDDKKSLKRLVSFTFLQGNIFRYWQKGEKYPLCHLCCRIILMACSVGIEIIPFCSVAKSCPTLCDPMTCSTSGFRFLVFFFLIDQETKALKCYICPLEYMLMKATVVYVLFTIVFSLCDSRLVQSNCSFALLTFAIEIHALTWLCCTSFSWTFLSFSLLFFFC